MKQLISVLILLVATLSFGQEGNSSFLTRNQPIYLFSEFESFTLDESFRLELPSELYSQSYQSDFMNFMANDNRLLNYPSADLSDFNDVIFGSFMNTSFNLGNTTTLNTFYIFDQSGRLINSTASFSFGKKKRN